MGMIKERIRTDEQNQRHRALVEENRRMKLKKFQQQQHENHLVISYFNKKETFVCFPV